MIELILRAQLGENNCEVRYLITKCVLSSVSKLAEVYNMDPWDKSGRLNQVFAPVPLNIDWVAGNAKLGPRTVLRIS